MIKILRNKWCLLNIRQFYYSLIKKKGQPSKSNRSISPACLKKKKKTLDSTTNDYNKQREQNIRCHPRSSWFLKVQVHINEALRFVFVIFTMAI